MRPHVDSIPHIDDISNILFYPAILRDKVVNAQCTRLLRLRELWSEDETKQVVRDTASRGSTEGRKLPVDCGGGMLDSL
jgi:hypothetical protein